MNLCETLYDLTCRGITTRFEPGERCLKIICEKTVGGTYHYARYVLGDPHIVNPDHETDEILIGLLNRMADGLEEQCGG